VTAVRTTVPRCWLRTSSLHGAGFSPPAHDREAVPACVIGMLDFNRPHIVFN
jgi:hypothetical protein